MRCTALLFAICALALFGTTDAEAKRYKTGWHSQSSGTYVATKRRARAHSSSRRANRSTTRKRTARGRARVDSGWHYAGESRPRRTRRARSVRSASYSAGHGSYGSDVRPRSRRARTVRTASYSADAGSYGGGSGVGPRPRQWCGWWMRTQLGGGAHFNLARSWRSYGSATAPQVGAVVVQGNHVGIITGRSGSGWIVKAGNDGGRVRERVWSLRGASIRI